MSVYVEALVQAPIERLWKYTQDPALHVRWDARFSAIDYLPKEHEDAPQRSRYTTRIGFGLAIAGEGESVGESDRADGDRSSALRFWSASSLSFIREGSGYWRYAPGPDGTRFITAYDYRTRFGRTGPVVDRLLFRPLMGWATAWSFDRLRLWLDRDIAPAISLAAAVIHAIVRLVLAFTFAYHGLIPKLLGRDADEVAMLLDAGVPTELLDGVLIVGGIAELALAITLLVFWHRRGPVVVAGAFTVLALVGVAIVSPGYLGAAFNPVTLDFALLALVVTDLVVLPAVPDAGRCRRRPAERHR